MILIGAAMFDKLDGALARKLGLTESPRPEKIPKKINMGNVLDDVSDAVSFCVAPAWIFFLCLSDATDPVLKALPVSLIAWLYFLLGITRLIYFTLDQNPVPGFFKGLPTPAAALLGIAPLIMFGQATAGAPEDLRFWGIICFAVMVLSSLLMNFYPIRYFHYGRFMSRHPVFVSLTFLVSLILAFTPYFGHFALFCMLIYTLSPLWTWRISPEVAARETRGREV
jgi:phosphatidylserine synthase